MRYNRTHMPKETPTDNPSNDDAADAKKEYTMTDIGEMLDEILFHMERLDKRDRLRTVGGFFGGLVRTIPIILMVGATYYMVTRGDEWMDWMIRKSAEQTTAVMQEQTNNMLDSVNSVDNDALMEQLKQFLPQ